MRRVGRRPWGWVGSVMLIGLGCVGGFVGPVWGQTGEPPLSITVEGGYTSREIKESGSVGQFSGTADSGRLLVMLAYRPVPHLTLYAVGGGASLKIEQFGYSADLNGSYGGGMTLSANLRPGMSVFLDGRYLRFVTDDRVVMSCGPNTPCSSATDERITWNEYRVRLGAKSRVLFMAPYGGLQVSLVRGDDHLNQYTNTGVPMTLNIKEKEAVGMFGGVTIPLDPKGRMSVFAEFDIIDENAIRGGLTFTQ
jgi:hypothetical protein